MLRIGKRFGFGGLWPPGEKGFEGIPPLVFPHDYDPFLSDREFADFWRELAGPHPDTVLGSHNLANLYYKLGGYDEAEATFVKTIQAKRRVFGMAHPLTIVTIVRLAEM